jgi:hypothetical protein
MMVARTTALFLIGLIAAASSKAQGDLRFPKKIEAGAAFSVQLPGSGQGTLYIVGPGGAIKKDVQLGGTMSFAAGALTNAGHYVVILNGGEGGSGQFDVVAADQAADLSFLAKPSRLPVSVRDGISGAVYVFDSYRNLATAPTQVQFELTSPSGATQTRSMTTHYGAAWSEFDSTPQQGAAKFVAATNGASSARVIRQSPGDPCAIKMSATAAGHKVQLTTEPLRDCSGNAVPDGTIVTFTQAYNGEESTVDVPLKRGIAEVQMPAHPGATISVASGVVLGNQIRWER